MNENLHSCIERILNHYTEARKQNLKGHELGRFIRNITPQVILNSLELDIESYKVEGSVGKGRWAEIPWIAIFDKRVTDNAQKGYYIVFLFNADMKGAYLSLNQGWKHFEKTYGKKEARYKLKKNSQIVKDKLNTVHKTCVSEIDLGSLKDLPIGYELGHICGRYYEANSLPNSETMISDLKSLLVTYNELVSLKGNRRFEEWNRFLLSEEDGYYLDNRNEEKFQEKVEENLPKFVVPVSESEEPEERLEPVIDNGGDVRWPRNANIAARAILQSGYCCEINANHKTFISKKTNKQYLEAHHLVPMAFQKKFQYNLDRLANIVALCPNCHRMIHLASDSQKIILLDQLFQQRKKRLDSIGILINFSLLSEFYKI